jgi:hypothetical protein
MRRTPLILITLAALAGPADAAEDEFTLYDLLDPATHRFAITYDVSVTKAGDRTFLNPIREGSRSSDERVVERASGRELRWKIVKGREAKAEGLAGKDASDEALFIRIELPSPVPPDGERRIRIMKTYADAKSYRAEGDRVVFERSLGIRRNAILLTAGSELVECTVPAIVSTEGGRVKASVLNDRDDALAVRITGRRLPAGGR